jgi:peptide methionine sulfoxide reductase MsrB
MVQQLQVLLLLPSLILLLPLRPAVSQQQQLVDTVFEHLRARTKPGGRCPPRPTYTECPLQPRMGGNAAERGLFSKICTPPQDRSVHATSGAEDPENRCHGVHSGVFTCGCCGHALFQASDKCESGTGWPSFSDAIGICIQEEYMDGDHGEHTGAHAREVCAHGPARHLWSAACVLHALTPDVAARRLSASTVALT